MIWTDSMGITYQTIKHVYTSKQGAAGNCEFGDVNGTCNVTTNCKESPTCSKNLAWIKV